MELYKMELDKSRRKAFLLNIPFLFNILLLSGFKVHPNWQEEYSLVKIEEWLAQPGKLQREGRKRC